MLISSVRSFLTVLGFSAATLIAPATATSVLAAPAYETTAQNAILVDAVTGTVLFEKNADERVHPASMSKLMTTYMLYDQLKRGAIKLTDTMPVSAEVWRKWHKKDGSTMFLNAGDRPTVEELLRGIVIQSGNDACDVVAEGLAGSEAGFADWMNRKGKEIGLLNSTFINASGYPHPDHWMTPRDIAILSYRLITDFPEYYHYFAEREYTYGNIRQYNRNPILGSVTGADGLKTGHTSEAGYGVAVSAVQDGRRLIAVINGTASIAERAREAERILTYGFRNFRAYKLLDKGQMVEEAPVWLGDQETIPLVAGRELTVLMERMNRADLRVKVVYDSPIAAPLKQGQEVGKIVVTSPNRPPVEAPLVAGAAVEKVGGFSKVGAALSHLLWGAAKSVTPKLPDPNATEPEAAAN